MIGTRTEVITVPQTLVYPDFRSAIRRGADLLDQRFGTEWRDAVDTDGLNLESTDACVLGQVFVTGIVNGAVQTVRGHQHYYGGQEFLFPEAAYAHQGDSYGAADKAAAHHGFAVLDADVAAWNQAHESDATSYSLTDMYEVLTKQWVEYLKDDSEDTD